MVNQAAHLKTTVGWLWPVANPMFRGAWPCGRRAELLNYAQQSTRSLAGVTSHPLGGVIGCICTSFERSAAVFVAVTKEGHMVSTALVCRALAFAGLFMAWLPTSHAAEPGLISKPSNH